MRPHLKNPDSLAIPERSAVLAMWCLPMLSKSLAADEAERAAVSLFDAVAELAKKQAHG